MHVNIVSFFYFIVLFLKVAFILKTKKKKILYYINKKKHIQIMSHDKIFRKDLRRDYDARQR